MLSSVLSRLAARARGRRGGRRWSTVGFVLRARRRRDQDRDRALQPRRVGLRGPEVRILGVPVGKVTAVVPEGNTVRVEMEYDAEYPVPDDAQAVIITPTLTADRFVQLTPAYTEGAKLADGAEIEVEDTGTPIELDRIYRACPT